MNRADQLLRRIEAIVAAMDPLTREVFLLHRVDGWSYARIAQELGIAIGEVEQHLAGAILAIDQGLRRDGL